MSESNAVECSLEHLGSTPEAHKFRVEVHNGTAETIHLLQTDRMPYRIQATDAGLILAWSIQQPDPDLDYFGLEVPMTEPLAAGATWKTEATVARPIKVRDHLAGSERDPDDPMVDPLTVRAEVGYVPYEIGKKERATKPYETVVGDQTVVTSDTLTIGAP